MISAEKIVAADEFKKIALYEVGGESPELRLTRCQRNKRITVVFDSYKRRSFSLRLRQNFRNGAQQVAVPASRIKDSKRPVEPVHKGDYPFGNYAR